MGLKSSKYILHGNGAAENSGYSEDGENETVSADNVFKMADTESSTPNTKAEVEELSKYIYPFENLVFEGGGNKGLAYCGVIKEMEKMGMMYNVRRFAGTSAGAMTATLLCVGFSGEEIQRFLTKELQNYLYDHSCGYCSLLPNLLRSYGWNPGRKLFRWFGDRMFETTQNRDVTFREVYEKFGRELCVVVTNVSQMSATYCHVKTTPDMPVALAVRMSFAIPGMFAATKLKMIGRTDVFVDGGLLCNYPIHCFDGWWLSMDPKDSFFKRLHPISKIIKLRQDKNRFGGWNGKTLGFLLYSEDEPEVYRTVLDARPGAELPNFPRTKLARRYKRKHKNRHEVEKESKNLLEATDVFFKVLGEHDIDENSTISAKELEHAFRDPTLTRHHREALFGANLTAAEAYDLIRQTKDMKLKAFRRQTNKQRVTEQTPISKAGYFPLRGKYQISFQDLISFFEANGTIALNNLSEFQRCDVTNFTSFFNAILECLDKNLKRLYMTDRDIERTVGINTGYLGTMQIDLAQQDIDFLVEQGRRAFVSFLRYYVSAHHPPLKS